MPPPASPRGADQARHPDEGRGQDFPVSAIEFHLSTPLRDKKATLDLIEWDVFISGDCLGV